MSQINKHNIDFDGVLYVKSKVMKYVHSKGFNCSASVCDGPKLDRIIKNVLDEAIIRARQNFRKTVIDRDL